MSTIALDYETFWIKDEYSVSDLGNWAYTHHESFDPFLLTVTDGSQFWAGNPKEFNWPALESAERILAHNAGFDKSVTSRLVELGIAPPFVLEKQWDCTADMSSCLTGSRNLVGAVEKILGERISKAARADSNGKHFADMLADGTAAGFVHYAIGDSLKCHKLWTTASSQWTEFERRLSRMTRRQCERGVRIDKELLLKYIEQLHVAIHLVEKSMPWTEKGKKPTSPIAIAEQCREVGIPCPPAITKDEEGFAEWERTYGPRFPWVYAAGRWRSLSKLRASLITLRDRIRPDDTVDFSLLYFGGHTGRWSGSGSKFNMQNMRKDPLYFKEYLIVTPPASLTYKEKQAWVLDRSNVDFTLDLRKLFIARPGKKFIVADLAQIEPRVLAWLTGNKPLLDLMRGGMSSHEAFARISMGWSGGDMKREDPDRYAMAKAQNLGLGYQCGGERFIEQAATYGVSLTLEQSENIVSGFREANPLLADKQTGIWARLDGLFRQSCGGEFTMSLPSGRKMVYRNIRREPRMKKDKEGKPKMNLVFTADTERGRKEFYGGKLTENLVQAVSRDVFGEHLLDLDGKIGDVIFHVHDEAITEVDPDVQPRDIEHIMSRTPDWIAGLPVAAEAHETQCYGKF